MHRYLFALTFALLSAVAPSFAWADEPHVDVTADPNAPLPDNAPAPPSPAQPYPWADLGPKNYGHNYQVYIPREMKSDDPDVLRTYEASGYPRNGLQQTPGRPRLRHRFRLPGAARLLPARRFGPHPGQGLRLPAAVLSA